MYFLYFPEMLHYRKFTKESREYAAHDMDYIRDYIKTNDNLILMGEESHAGS